MFYIVAAVKNIKYIYRDCLINRLGLFLSSLIVLISVEIPDEQLSFCFVILLSSSK